MSETKNLQNQVKDDAMKFLTFADGVSNLYAKATEVAGL